MNLRHVYNEFLIGREIEKGVGLRAGQIRVQWSDGRSFWHLERFVYPDGTPNPA